MKFFSTVFKDVIKPLFDPKLPEMLTIDGTDPFFVIRFLQSMYTNYLDSVNKDSVNLITEILVLGMVVTQQITNSILATSKL